MATAEERKLATVLFGDLVGSTGLAGSQDPERTRALLDRFYDAMAAEVEAAGGTIEKFAGDAVMAAFGAPAAQEDHAERALHAALSMQRRLEALFHGAVALRIGVNTGEVIVGRAREGSSFVTGDAVNVAKRLEEAAAPGAVLVGERTVASVRGAFVVRAASRDCASTSYPPQAIEPASSAKPSRSLRNPTTSARSRCARSVAFATRSHSSRKQSRSSKHSASPGTRLRRATSSEIPNRSPLVADSRGATRTQGKLGVAIRMCVRRWILVVAVLGDRGLFDHLRAALGSS